MNPDALRRYDLNLLITLNVLLEECNVSRAAERLHLSQSAISRSLGRLRDIFEDELFVRRPHGLQPTSRALEIQSELAEALNMVSRVVEPSSFDPLSCKHKFAISVMEHISVQLIPRLLMRLAKDAPNVRLRVCPWSKNSVSDMSSGKLDMCINIIPIDRPDIHRRVIAHAQACVFMSRNHPLAGRRNLNLNEYMAYPRIGVEIPEFQENPFVRKIMMLLGNREVLMSTPDHHLALQVVSDTQALMIGTTCLTRPIIEQYSLCAAELPPELKALKGDYQMSWHRLRHRDHAHIWFRQLVMEECEKLMNEEAETAALYDVQPPTEQEFHLCKTPASLLRS
ncbi:LysR family transcriptional regulator [Sansalvadorimonas sp. 2012CJ34-2]|uniref:LysR family transcriptional regulator n=1 Tax=Parendozoicomonas callyspongiae TaxID=2942213 RepID=A0ABT0PB84_9GAMM|nr:LysR family transcriptional regulator [Sansalvadorimonas sp. 2012CJ34-2]MCL6268639.1 LysR family transcriptional regulator [Sansalvadorimonas sp. 2012CJ34-2]